MTNNHVIDEKIDEINLKIKEEKESRIINLNDRIIYTNKEYDITIIEMNEEDNINDYLEIDDNIIDELNEEYLDKTIYIMQYPEGELSVSYGILDNIYIDKKYNFNHKCSTKSGSSGSPILNIKNNKLIGIHKESNDKKFNKGLFLNYPIKEYLQQKKLEEFNKKYNLNIQQDTTEIDLKDKGIGNEGLKDLCQIELKGLKKLYLEKNNISDIKVLENAKFEKLELLGLGSNKISDINILEKVKFKELKELYLEMNNISDIKVLENVNFEKLEILGLSCNNISDINVLEKVNFKELKELYLDRNNISDIKVLENTKFEKLEELYIIGNKIKDESIIFNLNIKNIV